MAIVKIDRKEYTHPNSFGNDGDDHINISCRGETRLGQVLDPSYYKVINYPYIGKFASVYNLWKWLQSKPLDDALRKLTGAKLRERTSTSGDYHHVPNFRAIIAYATYLKLKEYPDLLDELRRLPEGTQFLSYYKPRKTVIRICSSYASVVVPIAETITAALRNRQEPTFDCFVTEAHCGGLQYLEGFLKSNISEEALKNLSID